MNKSGFLKIHDVVRFVEDVFGDNQSFEIEGGDEVIRNEGKRSEDVVSLRTFIEQRGSDIVFSVTFSDNAASGTAKKLPEVFTNPDYPKVLRNRYRELNRTEIQYWKIDFHFTRLIEGSGSYNKITFRFTVRYGGEY